LNQIESDLALAESPISTIHSQDADETQLNSTAVTVGENVMTSSALRFHAAVHRTRVVC